MTGSLAARGSEASAEFGYDLSASGITPVRVKIDNRSDRTYAFSADAVQLVTQEGARTPPLTDASTDKLAGSLQPTVRKKRIPDATLAPKDVLTGFVYFPVSTYRRATVVLIDQERCRGYRKCVEACPYKKAIYRPTTRTSEKCIGCYPRLEGLDPETHGQPMETRCMAACIGQVRMQGLVRMERDGSWTLVVSPRDPGHPNWISTAGRRRGLLWFRWFLAAELPKPLEVAVVPLAQVPPG